MPSPFVPQGEDIREGFWISEQDLFTKLFKNLAPAGPPEASLTWLPPAGRFLKKAPQKLSGNKKEESYTL